MPGVVADAAAEAPPVRRLEYEERRPKTVLELQPWRRVQATKFRTIEGRGGVATLIDLNPTIGVWLLLRLEWLGGGDPEVYHLQNPFPAVQSVRLDGDSRTGLLLRRQGESHPCDLWSHGAEGALAAAREKGAVFAPLCGNWIFLRNPTAGRRTSKEWASEFLRDRVWGGEKITTLVRDTFFAPRYRRVGRLTDGGSGTEERGADAPAPPKLGAAAASQRITPDGLDLEVTREADGTLAAGRWYAVTGAPGIFVGTVRPDLVASEIVEHQKGRVDDLDPKEESALVYAVAFDLARFDLGFALGTEHPRVDWSERAPDAVRDEALPGPDGIGTVAPLVRAGRLSPAEAVRAAAVFAGGFKRSHGAFNSGELAARNQGTHYGFIEQGVILSKLQPGLSTLAVYADGHVSLATWTAERDEELPHLRYARQNGVPLLERDPVSGEVRPGALVRRWGAGNWSGSVDKKLRTLRAGACLQPRPGPDSHPPFLLYGLFTSATPSGMARVFEAYGCEHAMLLDMNAPEHTYLAVYRDENGRRAVERLIDEMATLDRVVGGETVPRFVGFPDNRDFFFLLRKEEP